MSGKWKFAYTRIVFLLIAICFFKVSAFSTELTSQEIAALHQFNQNVVQVNHPNTPDPMRMSHEWLRWWRRDSGLNHSRLVQSGLDKLIAFRSAEAQSSNPFPNVRSKPLRSMDEIAAARRGQGAAPPTAANPPPPGQHPQLADFIASAPTGANSVPPPPSGEDAEASASPSDGQLNLGGLQRNTSPEAYEIPERFKVNPIVELLTAPHNQFPELGLSRVHNALIAGILHYSRVNVSLRSGNEEFKPLRERALDEDGQWNELIHYLRIIYLTYSEPLESPTQPYRSAEEYFFATDPMRHFFRDMGKSIDFTVERFRAGKLPVAVAEESADDLANFAGDRPVLSQTIATDFQRTRKSRRMAVVDGLGSGKGKHVGGTLLSSIMQAIGETAFSSLSAISTSIRMAGRAADGVAAKRNQANNPNGDPATMTERADGIADGIDTFQANLASEEGVIELVEKMLRLAEDQPHVAFEMFRNIQDKINGILSQSLTSIPLALINNAFNTRASRGSDEQFVSRFLNFLFNRYMPELSSEELKNIFYRLLTIDPRANDRDCAQLLVAHFYPLIINFLQHFLEDSKIEIAQELSEMLQSFGLTDTPYEVLERLGVDPMGIELIYVHPDEIAPQTADLIERYGNYDDAEKGTPVLINFIPYPSRAGKAVQMHSAMVIDKGKIVPVATLVGKGDFNEHVEADRRNLIYLAPELAGLILSNSSARKAASEMGVLDFIEYIYMMAIPEGDPVRKRESHRVANIRFSRVRHTEKAGRPISVVLNGAPHFYRSVPGSSFSVAEFVKSASFDETKEEHPLVAAALGESVSRVAGEELAWNAINKHPLIEATEAWLNERGIAFGGDYPNWVFHDGNDLDRVVNCQEDFGYEDSNVRTLGDHIELMIAAKLKYGALPSDPHKGNLLVHPTTTDGDTLKGGLTFIDNPVIAWLSPEQQPSIFRALTGIKLKDTMMITEGIYGLAIKEADWTSRKKLQLFRKIKSRIEELWYDDPKMFKDIGSIIFELRFFYDIEFPIELFALHQPSRAIDKVLIESGADLKREIARNERIIKANRGAILNTADVSLWRIATGQIRRARVSCSDFIESKVRRL